MSGFIQRLMALRDAAGEFRGVYAPAADSLLRRLAERLSDDQVADVADLLRRVREG